MENVKKDLSAQEARLLALFLSAQSVEGARSVHLTAEQVNRSLPEMGVTPGEERLGASSAEWHEALGHLKRVTEELVNGSVVLSETQAHCPNVDGASVTSTQTFSRAGTANTTLNLIFLTLSGEQSFNVTSGQSEKLEQCGTLLTIRAALLKRIGYAYDKNAEADFYVYDFDSWQGDEITYINRPVTDCPCRTGTAFPREANEIFKVSGPNAKEVTRTSKKSLTLSLNIGIGSGPALTEIKNAPLQIKGTSATTTEVTLKTVLPAGHTYMAFTTDEGVQQWTVRLE
ncbi:hypothetical protein [Deinococcus arenicola]|uniref:Uncharacterized protein n=1 Tax=Deinococcus arenicola TaxID=2994950 RepID=A0ABU4DTZ9_9DEIO|nr:hypothetical protein [Deinococcus sp. ZS9-10]MDV6375896.1 hypothetical protein [Deinococcus sp. ZS9-10]